MLPSIFLPNFTPHTPIYFDIHYFFPLIDLIYDDHKTKESRLTIYMCNSVMKVLHAQFRLSADLFRYSSGCANLIFLFVEMGLFHVWLGSRYMFIIHFVSWLALLCHSAFAQFDISEGLTGSTNIPGAAITCLGNLAVFLTCLVRGRLHSEMGVRDLLDLIIYPKLHSIRGFGVTTCPYIWKANAHNFGLNLRDADVVMLSKKKPNRSMRQFMKYTHRVYAVRSIHLQILHLSSGEVAAEMCYCCHPKHACHCIVLNTVEDITMRLAERMPGTLKRLSDSQCLLPCLTCLRNGCHGCNQGLLYAEDVEEEAGRKRLTEGVPKEWPVAAVCEILDTVLPNEDQCSCICIPSHPAENDEWTKMLITSLKTKDNDARGVVSLSSDAMQNYIAQCGVCNDREEYRTFPLIVPRLVEALLNIILTGWLRVDGFSSAMLARRVVRDYIVDSRGCGIAGNAFLTKSVVYSNVENTNVCQVLTFRGNLASFGMFSILITCVNLFCSVTWVVLIALEGGAGKWYEPHAMPLSEHTIYVIMVAIGVDMCLTSSLIFIRWRLIFRSVWNGLGLRTSILNVRSKLRTSIENGDIGVAWNNETAWVITFIMVKVTVMFAFEVYFLVLGARGHLKAFGKWFYGALQALVWVKWGYRSIEVQEYSQALFWVKWGYRSSEVQEYSRLQEYSRKYDRDMVRNTSGQKMTQFRLAYASTFLLNAIFVGVRGKWKYMSS